MCLYVRVYRICELRILLELGVRYLYFTRRVGFQGNKRVHIWILAEYIIKSTMHFEHGTTPRLTDFIINCVHGAYQHIHSLTHTHTYIECTRIVCVVWQLSWVYMTEASVCWFEFWICVCIGIWWCSYEMETFCKSKKPNEREQK